MGRFFRFMRVFTLVLTIWLALAPTANAVFVDSYRYGVAAVTYVNSVQQVSISLSSGENSDTATISAVGANAFVLIQGARTNGSAADLEGQTYTRAELTNSTTVTAYRNSSASATTVVKALVIDPTSSLVTGVQQGTITLSSATSNTATISSVNTSLSAVFYLGNTTSGSTSATSMMGVTLTNATTVTANLASSGSGTLGYVVVTFASAAIQSIQQYTATSTAVSASDTATISAVTMANAMIASGGYKNSDSDDTRRAYYREQLTATTTVTFNRGAGGAGVTRTHYGAVVEFVSGVVKTMNRGTITVNGATSNTATISAVTTGKTAVQKLGHHTGSNLDAVPDQHFVEVVLTDSTTITADKTTSTSSTIIAYEAIEFN